MAAIDKVRLRMIGNSWSTLIGRELSRLCSDWLMLLRQLSYAIRVASMHGKVLLGVTSMHRKVLLGVICKHRKDLF